MQPAAMCRCSPSWAKTNARAARWPFATCRRGSRTPLHERPQRRRSRGAYGSRLRRRMAEQLGDWTRTHTCGGLRTTDLDKDATLLGWVHRVRDLGGVLFIDIRDREGISQVVFRDDEAL